MDLALYLWKALAKDVMSKELEVEAGHTLASCEDLMEGGANVRSRGGCRDSMELRGWIAGQVDPEAIAAQDGCPRTKLWLSRLIPAGSCRFSITRNHILQRQASSSASCAQRLLTALQALAQDVLSKEVEEEAALGLLWTLFHIH